MTRPSDARRSIKGNEYVYDYTEIMGLITRNELLNMQKNLGEWVSSEGENRKWKQNGKERNGLQDLALKIILCYYLLPLLVLVFLAPEADFLEKNLAPAITGNSKFNFYM